MYGLVVAAVVAVMASQVDGAGNALNPLTAFPSPHLQSDTLLPLMNDHIQRSLKQLLTSKLYGGQDVQQPGLAKLLAEESDRHWEEGINVLKKYLQAGGEVVSDSNFAHNFIFNGTGDVIDSTRIVQSYQNTIKEQMVWSRNLVNKLTNSHHLAIQKKFKFGDVSIAHFLAEQAEKEAEVAHKMAASWTTLDSIKNNGVAFDMFDQHI